MVIASPSRLGRQGPSRRGAISVALLVFYGIMLIVLIAVVQQLSWRSHARVELQNADDAAAHAAACTLVTDSVFALPYVSGTSMVDDRAALIQNAFAVGKQFAALNRVVGKPLVLADNPQNLTDGELYVGTLDAPLSRTFINLTNPYYDPYNPDLNAVRVVTRRERAAASATYYADRDVLGFRVRPTLSSSPLFPAIPLVPIAILSDPCPPSGNTLACWASKGPSTWENQIMARQSVGGPGASGFPTIALTLTEGGGAGNNGQLVYLDPGNPSFATLLAQAAGGVAYGDLPANGVQLQGQFLLNNSITPSMNFATPLTQPLPLPTMSSGGGAAALQTSLQGIVGQRRVWMLYSFVPDPNNNNNPTFAVVGFVAARVLSVTVGNVPMSSTLSQVTIVLQPSALITETAVTARHRRDLGPRSLYNPYIARVRIVE